MPERAYAKRGGQTDKLKSKSQVMNTAKRDGH